MKGYNQNIMNLNPSVEINKSSLLKIDTNKQINKQINKQTKKQEIVEHFLSDEDDPYANLRFMKVIDWFRNFELTR